jgi:hypothetical protein
MDADICEIPLLLDDERTIGEEAEGSGLAEVLVVVGLAEAEGVGRPGVFDELIM